MSVCGRLNSRQSALCPDEDENGLAEGADACDESIDLPFDPMEKDRLSMIP